MGFHRGAGRGASAGGMGQQRGGGGGRGVSRGGFQPGRFNQPKEKLKFDSEYDFDKANEEFKEVTLFYFDCRLSLFFPTIVIAVRINIFIYLHPRDY